MKANIRSRTRKNVRENLQKFLFPLGILCVLVAALGSPAAAQSTTDVRPPKLNFTTHKLSNGLEVILLEDHAVPVINLQVWYHVGSKDERPGRSGFAHLFEHLMFKGSAHVGADEHSRIIEAVGGFDNAETSDDTTNFFETFPSNYLERVLWLEADRMGSLNVDEANFKSERQVVEEERRVRVDNQPYGTLEEDLRAAAFTVHAYHHTADRQHRRPRQGDARRRARFLQHLLQAKQRDARDRGRFQFQPGAWLGEEIFRGHSGFGQTDSANQRAGTGADGRARRE